MSCVLLADLSILAALWFVCTGVIVAACAAVPWVRVTWGRMCIVTCCVGVVVLFGASWYLERPLFKQDYYRTTSEWCRVL